MTSRLKPTNPVADTAILVGDPGRALMLAQELLVNPLMSNHARGLWGYTSATPDGRPLTIQATGMGGPSAAIVLADLARLGVRRAVRLGTCEALTAAHRPGTIVTVNRVEATDGVSRSLGVQAGDAPGGLAPEAELGQRLREAGPAVTVRSGDLSTLLRQRLGVALSGTDDEGADVADLQTGALFSVAAALGMSVAALLVVERTPAPAVGSPDGAPADGAPAEDAPAEPWDTVAPDLLEAQIKLAGRIAARALA